MIKPTVLACLVVGSLLFASPASSQITFPYSVPANPTAEIDVNTSIREPIEPMNFSLNYGARSFHAFNVEDDKTEFRRFDPPSTRWPIGVWANWYNWETDSWETDTSYTLAGYNGPITQYPQKKYGFPGFTQLHDEMNFDVLWSFNVDYDSPAKAANRMNDRYDKGFDFKWIELGNEIFWKDQRSWATETVELYMGVAENHATALKSEDPFVQLAVPATWRDDSGTGWNGGLMVDQTFYDAITVHKYIRHTSNVTTADVKEVMMAGVVLKDTADDMAALFPGKPQWYSEWGVTCGENAISVLGMSDMFLTFFRHQNLFAMNQYHQVNGMDEFITPDDDKTAYGAAYDVLRAVFEGGELYTSMETATPLDSNVAVVQSAAVNKNGSLIVFAQNKTPNSIPFTIKLDGSAYTGNADHRTFAFASLNAFPQFEIEEDPLTVVALQTASIILPPYSMNVISGLSMDETIASEIRIEAESAEGQAAFGPYETQMELGGHTFIKVADGNTTVNYNVVNEPLQGWATYDFELLEAGDVSIEVLGKFASSSADSFWYRFDGGTWIKKDGLVGGNWKWVTLLNDQSLAVGSHVLQVARREPATRLDCFRLTTTDGTFADPQMTIIPSSGTTRIEAEDYDKGGEAVGYHDRTSGNTGGEYRTDHVDLQTCGDVGGGYQVGWIEAGEWLQYSVDVQQAGLHDLRLRVARSPAGDSSIRILVDNEFETGDLAVPSTGAWENWADVDTSISLSKGKHLLRIKATGDNFNLNYLEMTAQGSPGSLPSPWQSQDVGTVAAEGLASYLSDTFTVAGSGSRIFGQSDHLQYAYQAATGSSELIARVSAMDNTGGNARAGVMVRESLDSGSRHFSIFVTPDNDIVYSQRTTTGGFTSNTTVAVPIDHYWLKIERDGNLFKGSYSTDGKSWTLLQSQGFLISDDAYIGLAVTSGDDGTLCNATLDNISISATLSGTPPTIADIGDSSISVNTNTGAMGFTIGDAETAEGSLTVTGSSSDLTLVPSSGIAFGGSGTARTVTVTPATNQLGSATITVTVSDGVMTAIDTFVLTVTGSGRESWRFEHFGSTANTGNAADSFDSNGDGESNLLEFATGQVPDAGTIMTTSIAPNGANMEFSYTRSHAAMADGVIFSVEWSDTLEPGPWSTEVVGEEVTFDNGSVQRVKVTVPTGMGSRRFVHLKIDSP